MANTQISQIKVYKENTLYKLICKPKDGVAKKHEKNIVYGIDCNNCETVHSIGSKQSLKFALRRTQNFYQELRL